MIKSRKKGIGVDLLFRVEYVELPLKTEATAATLDVLQIGATQPGGEPLTLQTRARSIQNFEYFFECAFVIIEPKRILLLLNHFKEFKVSLLQRIILQAKDGKHDIGVEE